MNEAKPVAVAVEACDAVVTVVAIVAVKEVQASDQQSKSARANFCLPLVKTESSQASKLRAARLLLLHCSIKLE